MVTGEGVTVFGRMLDRDYVDRSGDYRQRRRLADPASDVMVSGLQAVAALGATRVDEGLGAPVAALAEADQSLRVRQAAMETLEAARVVPDGQSQRRRTAVGYGLGRTRVDAGDPAVKMGHRHMAEEPKVPPDPDSAPATGRRPRSRPFQAAIANDAKLAGRTTTVESAPAAAKAPKAGGAPDDIRRR